MPPADHAEAARADALEAIRGRFVCSIDQARLLLDLGRVAAYKLAATRGALAEGVPVLRCGRLFKVPVRPLLRAVLGDAEADNQGED